MTLELPAPGPRRRRRAARVLSWFALGTAVVVLLGAGGLWIAFNHYVGQIRSVALPPVAGHQQPAAAPENAQNFLLVGSDNRDGANGIGTQGTGATFVRGQRSDTIILVHLFGGRNDHKAELLSFPRDSYVEIPRWTSPGSGTVTAAHHGKLNSAYSLGGPSLLIATVESLTDIRVDHYLQVDFSGFKRMVDEVGGVDVCLTRAARDTKTGIDLTAGPHHISGDVALQFVRQRYGLPNSDLDRIARQQQFIGSLVHQVLSANTLLNPLKLNGFLDAATASLKVDKGLSGSDIRHLLLRLRHADSGGVLFTTVPISDAGAKVHGSDVVLLDSTRMAAVFTALRRDRVPSTATPLVVLPRAVHVTVVDASGAEGLAATAGASLRRVGFHIVVEGTSAVTGATTVRFGPSRADSARTLQAAVPGAVLVPDPRLGTTLQLVLGSTYRSTSPTTVAPAPTTKVTSAAHNACTA